MLIMPSRKNDVKINYDLIIDKTIEVKWHNPTKRHYINLGYKFTKTGDTFQIDIKHLPFCSNLKVNMICIDCKDIRFVKFGNFAPTCRKCIIIRINNSRTSESRSFAVKEMWQNPTIRESIVSKLKSYVGPKNSAWIHDRTKLKTSRYRGQHSEDIAWAKEVKKIYDYTCQVCFDNSGGNLVSHHLNPYSVFPELRREVSNGICLCRTCHSEFHKLYGIKKANEEKFMEYKNIKHFESLVF